jgi:hypothetical protein
MSVSRVDDLVGSWRLESAVEVFDDGVLCDEFGPNPEGYLCYTSVGVVSAVLGDSARPPASVGDPQSGTDPDYGAMARRFIAYAGLVTVGFGKGTVTHRVDVSLFSNWQGHDQVRRPTIEGGRLRIIASDRTSADRRTSHSELIGQRV